MQKLMSPENNIDIEPKSIKRSRKKSSYRKINNETRQKLIEMVYLKDFLLKDAAKILNINYSTAKTILRIFRLEKRISKKNSPDINSLQSIKREKIKKFQIIRNKKKDSSNKSNEAILESISNTTFLSNSNSREHHQLAKTLQECIFPSSLLDTVNTENQQYDNQGSKFTDNSSQFNNNNLLHLLSSPENLEQMNNFILYMNFSNTIQNLASMINVCFENLKFNQNMINVIMNHLNGNKLN